MLSNAKSRVTVLYECGVCHRAVEAVQDVKRGEHDAPEGSGSARHTWRDVEAYRASLREPRPLPTHVDQEPPEPEADPRPRAKPIRPAPRVRVTRRPRQD